jgi:hypothetical protein
MITDPSIAAILQRDLNQTQLYILILEVVIIYLYADVKEPMDHQNVVRGILDFRVSSAVQSQNGGLCFIISETWWA